MEEEKKEHHLRTNQLINGSRRVLEVEDEELRILSPKVMTRGRRRIKYCGIAIAVVLLQIVVLGVLCLTLFRFKDPNIKLDSTIVENLNVGLVSTPSTINMSLSQEILIKNQNWGGFKYDESAVVISYGGVTVGQGTISKGSIKLRKSKMVSVVVEVKVEEVGNDISSGVLGLKSYTKISGKVSMVGMVKKRRTGEMNCSLNISLANKKIQDFNCH
ncbi:PREDICTED: uncharacterized protein LOC101303168 [Fragaria vesca subsp. vesca]|uniref:uncharacterized protein LOC101303168 n=1 Tax=Fragaria vesca subsp. vesca TaxID=101020 RepID=UPI0002C2FA98|nr:PREDICTED: uncharacterized protein LOC101303168 [Fragaria vesca subsp. vesca]